VEVRALSLADVRNADELFFSGTAVEVTPIKELDGKSIGNGGPGPVTKRIQTTYLDAVHGKLPQYRAWLSPVGSAATATV
jgi:branched-chain amino acid aminotransferase